MNLDQVLREMARMQSLIDGQARTIRRLETRLGQFPARWPKYSFTSDNIRVGKLYNYAAPRGGESELREWTISDSGGLYAQTDNFYPFIDIGVIEEEQSPVPIGTIARIIKIKGMWVLLDFDRKAIDFEAKLTEYLPRDGEATAVRRRWNGVSWDDTAESITVKDLKRIPIGKKLDVDDIIGVRRIQSGYFLGDYDCEDLIDA